MATSKKTSTEAKTSNATSNGIQEDAGNRFAFTKAKLERIPLPVRPEKPAARGRTTTDHHVYYDEKCSCLALRVSSNGVKSFFAYRWNPEKKQTERTSLGKYSHDAFQGANFEKNPLFILGTNTPLSIEMARVLATAVVGSQYQKQCPDELTLAELFEQYMSRHIEKSRKTGDEIRKTFARHLNQWGKRRLSSISHTECESLHGRLGKGPGEYAANRCIQLLRAVYNKGKDWKLFQGENPAEGITLFKEHSRERFLSEKEIGKLFKALDEAPRDTQDLIRLSLFTAARKMNMCSMRWGDVDLKRGLWTIPDTKSGGSQTISLTSQEVEILAARRKYLSSMGKLGIFVFPSESKTGHLMDPKRSWASLREDAELEDFHFHDLRRSLGSWMASGGANLALIKGALGHKDMKTTMQVYARTKKDSERDAREAAHRAMEEAAKTDFEEKVIRIKEKAT